MVFGLRSFVFTCATALDTVAPVIETSSATFNGPAGTVVPVGGQVSLTIQVTGNSLVPKVTLFNGAGTATTTDSSQSPYTFTYTIQTGDDGPIVYTVEAEDQVGNKAMALVKDEGRSAGTVLAQNMSSSRILRHRELININGRFCLPDSSKVQPSIAAGAFGGPKRALIGVGSAISVTLTVSGTSAVPSVTLFNGARDASTVHTTSPYIFTYSIQAGDNGAVVYRVQTQAQDNSAAADVTLTDPGHFAGMDIACQPTCVPIQLSLLPMHHVV